MIDFYALRSEQYEWFVRLFDEFEVSRNLSLLPNFAYSVALAHFYRQDSEEKADQVTWFYLFLQNKSNFLRFDSGFLISYFCLIDPFLIRLSGFNATIFSVPEYFILLLYS